MPQALLANMGEVLYALVAGRRAHAADVVDAWRWNMRRAQWLARRGAPGASRTAACQTTRCAPSKCAAARGYAAFWRGQLGGEDRGAGDGPRRARHGVVDPTRPAPPLGLGVERSCAAAAHRQPPSAHRTPAGGRPVRAVPRARLRLLAVGGQWLADERARRRRPRAHRALAARCAWATATRRRGLAPEVARRRCPSAGRARRMAAEPAAHPRQPPRSARRRRHLPVDTAVVQRAGTRAMGRRSSRTRRRRGC